MRNIEENLDSKLRLKYWGHLRKIYKSKERLAILRSQLRSKLWPIKYSAIPKKLLARYKKVKQKLGNVDRMPFRKFIETFGTSKNLKNNIANWEAAADAFQAYTKNKQITDYHKRKEIFGILLFAQSAGFLKGLMSAPLLSPKDFGYKRLTKNEIFEINRCYLKSYRAIKKKI